MSFRPVVAIFIIIYYQYDPSRVVFVSLLHYAVNLSRFLEP